MRARVGVRTRLRRVAGVALGAVTVALAILVLFAPSVLSTVLRGAGLWPHGDRYTALYFASPNAPLERTGPRSRPRIAFAVESHAAARRTYAFRVTVGKTPQSQGVVNTGTLTLAPGRSRVETVELPRALRRHQLVEVSLSSGDAISYWTP